MKLQSTHSSTKKYTENEKNVIDFLFFWGRPIKVGELTKHLNIKHSTLNSILKKLVSLQIINWEKYGPVELTLLGKESAMHITNHHFIIEKFLSDTLDIPEELAHQEALNLSAVMSCTLIEKICDKYGLSSESLNYEYCKHRKYKIH